MRHRVLVIDDDPFDQALIRTAFQRVGAGADLELVPDVGVAIGFITERRMPSLLIVDLKLGYESGLELIQWVRTRPDIAWLPVIVLSGSDDPADVRAAYAAGANAYLRKPDDLDGLEALVRRLDEFWLDAAELPSSGEASPFVRS